MKVLKKLEISVATLANLAVFAICAGAFILIFFFPEKVGEIAGRIMNGFNSLKK